MKNIKIFHFQFNSRSVITKAMLHHKKVPYEDIRIKEEDWRTLKYRGNFEFRNLSK